MVHLYDVRQLLCLLWWHDYLLAIWSDLAECVCSWFFIHCYTHVYTFTMLAFTVHVGWSQAQQEVYSPLF